MTIVSIALAVLMAIIFLTRIPLGLAMTAVGLGAFALQHPRGLTAALATAEREIVNLAFFEQFAAMPLFVAMGVFVVRAGLADDLFHMASTWMGHRKGGLGLASILACGGFAALSGSSTASAATMARICVPQMKKAGYDDGFGAAVVAAGGTMGILIPPSGALIVYALLTDQSISELFIAGMIPGMMQLAIYLAVVWLVARLRPGIAPVGPIYSWSERMQALSRIWAVLALFGMVMAGLVTGFFTATEAAGFGAGGAFLFALARGRIDWSALKGSLRETSRISAMIFIVAAGAMVLNQAVNLSGLTGRSVELIGSLGLAPWQVIAMLIAFYLVLGCFLDGFAIIFLTVPVVAPLVAALGYDVVWWGIVTVVVVEISLITPPVGMNVFILKTVLKEVPVGRIFAGIAPFFVADLARLAILLAFPVVALGLKGFAH